MTDDEITQARTLCDTMGDVFAINVTRAGRAAHELKLLVPKLLDEVERAQKLQAGHAVLIEVLKRLKAAQARWCAEEVDDAEEMWRDIPQMLDGIVLKMEKALEVTSTGQAHL